MSLSLKPQLTATLAIALFLAPVSAAASPGGPLSVLAAFEEAWCESRPDLVEEILAADRIALSLSDAGPQDEAYTRTQAAYLIKDALTYRITETFGFVEFHWSEEGAYPPYGIARWEFRLTEGGPVRDLMLRVTLRADGPGWVVADIRVEPAG